MLFHNSASWPINPLYYWYGIFTVVHRDLMFNGTIVYLPFTVGIIGRNEVFMCLGHRLYTIKDCLLPSSDWYIYCCGGIPSRSCCCVGVGKLDHGFIPELLPPCGEIMTPLIGVGLMACGGTFGVAMGDTNMLQQISWSSLSTSHCAFVHVSETFFSCKLPWWKSTVTTP